MDFSHITAALAQLWSFSHAQCDTVLQSRHIEIENVYFPNKAGWARDGVYSGFLWITGWLAVIAASLLVSWRRQDRSAKVLRLILPLALLFAFFLLWVQLQGMAHYVDICRRQL
ncbi:MAG TPA: hypothetical protein VFF63_04225 [Candidatus Babeliales bacterium]|nr:hypothetical protein [Candidatus Babeliales bacterium]